MAPTERDGAPGTRWTRWTEAMARPVDGASAAVFRIAFGLLLVVDVFLYVPVLAREYYIDPSFSFGYGPLSFVAPPPGQGVRLVYLAMAVCGALVALGWHTRVAAAGVALTNTYIFLLDSTYFQNHIYLISLLAVLLVVLPTDRCWSLAARGRGGPTTVPAGVVWMLRFQVGVPYLYGGLAKLNADWLGGEPLRMWLAARTDVGPIDAVLTAEAVVMFMTYGALVFDLAVVPLLLIRRTRVPAFVVAVCFHVTNAWLFGLFVFPWLMIAATTVFFPPWWPRVVGERLRRRLGRAGPEAESGVAVRPGSGSSEVMVGPGRIVPASPPSGAVPLGLGRRGVRRLVVLGAVLWVAVQLLVPLRHVATPDDPSWTEQAHRFAWHMRLREKSATVRFLVDDGERVVEVDLGQELGEKQIARLGGHPERLVLYARHLSARYGGAAVRAETSVSLNGRLPQAIVDPEVDLASVTYSSHGRNDWILPLTQPRRRSSDPVG